MRSDYALYVVAILLFAITAISLRLELAETERNLYVVTTAVLGLLFIGLGYTQRPKSQAKMEETPIMPASQPTAEVAKEEKTEAVVEAEPKILGLTDVKGIKEKRAAQLKALGINSVEDLANASAGDLAKKLKISPKITEKWIESAKELLSKS